MIVVKFFFASVKNCALYNALQWNTVHYIEYPFNDLICDFANIFHIMLYIVIVKIFSSIFVIFQLYHKALYLTHFIAFVLALIIVKKYVREERQKERERKRWGTKTGER